jgi:hypothetical protein
VSEDRYDDIVRSNLQTPVNRATHSCSLYLFILQAPGASTSTNSTFEHIIRTRTIRVKFDTRIQNENTRSVADMMKTPTFKCTRSIMNL